eukprot:4523166-Amphidinium_carterae.2
MGNCCMCACSPCLVWESRVALGQSRDWYQTKAVLQLNPLHAAISAPPSRVGPLQTMGGKGKGDGKGKADLAKGKGKGEVSPAKGKGKAPPAKGKGKAAPPAKGKGKGKGGKPEPSDGVPEIPIGTE